MSKELAKLQAKLGKLKTEGLGIVEAAEAEDRDLTDEETARITEIKNERDEIQGEIDAINRRADARRSMEAIGGGAEGDQRSRHGQYAVNDDHNAPGRAGFKDLMEFAVTVRSACAQGAIADDRLRGLTGGGAAPGPNSLIGGVDGSGRRMAAPTNFHTGGGDAGEGFSLPTDFRDDIFEVMEQADDLTPLLDEETTSKRKVSMLANEETPWSSTGVQANWRSEGSQMSASKLDDDNRTVTLHEAYSFILATGELMEDAPRLMGRLTKRAGQALAWLRTEAHIRGTGAGQPLGWMNAAALITVAKESGQAADTLQAENILKMYSRLMVVPGDNPFWLANRNTVTELATMSVGQQPVWLPPNGMAAAPGGFLLGLPVKWSEHTATLGDVGDLMLVSGKGYYSLRRDAGPQLASSIHLYFDYNVEAFRWMTRFGGQPHLSAAVDAPTTGGGSANSKSHFVTLAERA